MPGTELRTQRCLPSMFPVVSASTSIANTWGSLSVPHVDVVFKELCAADALAGWCLNWTAMWCGLKRSKATS